MSDAPECRWRGKITQDACRCRSPKIIGNFVTLSTCHRCPYADHEPGPVKRRKSLGFGDTVANFLKAIGVKKQCGGCKKRQKALNEMFPYKSD